MANIKAIQIRLTRQQYEKMKNETQRRGFNSLSTYIRHQTLHRDDIIERKIHEIHHAVTEVPKQKRPPKYHSNKNELRDHPL